MNIQINNNLSSYNQNNMRAKNINFKGYDARPLRSIVMTTANGNKSFNVIKQMAEIGNKCGFKVFFTNPKVECLSNLDNINNAIHVLDYRPFVPWAQDHAVVTPKNSVLTNANAWLVEEKLADKIAHLTGGKYISTPNFIAGGNIYFIKSGNKNELLIGNDDLIGKNIKQLRKEYNVSKIYPIPQADFHIDLFLRPLNNKKILLADDELTLSYIKQGVSNIEKYLKENDTSVSETAVLLKLRMDLLYMVKSFSHTVKCSNVAGLKSVSRALKNHGFEVVKVPGRLYDIDSMMCSGSTLNHFLNYMNGVVHENPDGSLVYITNKSNLNKQFNITPEISEKIGFDFEKMFLDKISPYIKKENVYFIDNIADDLHNLHGGIHCLCNEIPKDIPNTFNSNSADNYVPVKIGLINRIINYLIDLLN